MSNLTHEERAELQRLLEKAGVKRRVRTDVKLRRSEIRRIEQAIALNPGKKIVVVPSGKGIRVFTDDALRKLAAGAAHARAAKVAKRNGEIKQVS